MEGDLVQVSGERPASGHTGGSQPNGRSSRAMQGVLCGTGQGAAVQNGGEGGVGFIRGFSGVMTGGNPVVSTLTGHQNCLGEGPFKTASTQSLGILIQ